MRLSLVMVPTEKLQQLVQDPSEVFGLLMHGDPETRLAYDKQWHGIHYLLTGAAWPDSSPLSIAIFGAEDIGEDLGYGAARTLSAEQVQQIAQALSEVSIDELRSRYDAQAMTQMNVYPEVWEREGDEALAWLLTGFRRLVDFYASASVRRNAVVLAIL